MSIPGLPRSALSRPSSSYSPTRSATTHGRQNTALSTSYGEQPSRPSTTTGCRSRAGSHLSGEVQRIICAVSESRGITPTVGLSFVNLSTGEAVLSQICDNQFYARTLHKIEVFEPSEILVVSSSAPPNQKTKMYQIIEENIVGIRVTTLDRKHFSEVVGLEYITQLAFLEDREAIKLAVEGNFYAVCSFAAALRHINAEMHLTFAPHTLRIKYQPSEGTMMIDLATIHSLELIQNIQNAKSKACLFGLMNETLTPMGSRLLRSCILQPSTQVDVLTSRYDAVTELSQKEVMFHQVRKALKYVLDIEKLLSTLIIIPTDPDLQYAEQSINNILMLRTFVQNISALYEALIGANSALLATIQSNLRPQSLSATLRLIDNVVNHDAVYQTSPLDLRNQRIYAVKSGVSGLLDVARQTFKEATEDTHQHISNINQLHEMQAETRYENARRYYLRVSESEFEGRQIPDILINRVRKKGFLECQTMEILKLNQKIEAAHQEVVMMSDKTVQTLLDDIRQETPILYRVCESVALLDMLAGLVQLATTGEEYTRPEITDCLAIKSGRHPIKEKIHDKQNHIPNDVFATRTKRFQIITGCNMSGKSTYLRMIALMSVMAQVGSFVPASYASFPIIHQLFARVSMDDSIEANMSTFAAEMQETAFILRNIDHKSLAIIDELGRGTSTRDGLAIALSIAEALVDSQAIVYFATHFRELAQILDQREGVVNMHFTVEMRDNSISMLYKLGNGFVQEEHYGLALARVVNLPPKVLEVAEYVSKTLEDQIAAKKKSSRSFAVVQRRKLLLQLKAQLEDLEKGQLTEKPLRAYLKKLQDEFVARMEAIDRNTAGGSSDDEEEEVVNSSATSVSRIRSAESSMSRRTESEEDRNMLI